MTDFEKSILEASLVQLAFEKAVRKMELCHIYGGNCGVCMIAAPYPYCCRKECGNNEYCEGCSYNDKESVLYEDETV